MKKNYFKPTVMFLMLLFALSSLNLFSQFVDPSKIYIDLTKKNQFSNDKFYIILSAHAKEHSQNGELNSNVGHAWVVFGRENSQAQKSEVLGYGFWPNKDLMNIANINSDGKTDFEIAKTVLPGDMNSVPGILKDDLFQASKYNNVNQVVFSVDETEYNKAFKVISDYKMSGRNYKLIASDCVKFIIDVGNAIGLSMPDRTKKMFPIDYITYFIEKLTSPNKLPTQNNTGSISGNRDYSYNYYEKDGLNEYENKGMNGNALGEAYGRDVIKRQEVKYRNKQITSKCSFFSNGDVWKFCINPDNPKKPKSELEFTNGNVYLDYDVTIGRMCNNNLPGGEIRLKSGAIYLGPIKNNMANGNGRIVIYDQNGTPQKWSTGTFKDDELINYNPHSMQFDDGDNVKDFMGDVIYGKLNGECTYEWANGDKYAGKFKDGKYNGDGKYTFKDGSWFRGNFVNGYLNGPGEYEDVKFRFEGTFSNHMANGPGKVILKKNNCFYTVDFKDNVESNRKFYKANGMPLKESEKENFGFKNDIYDGSKKDGSETSNTKNNGGTVVNTKCNEKINVIHLY